MVKNEQLPIVEKWNQKPKNESAGGKYNNSKYHLVCT